MRWSFIIQQKFKAALLLGSVMLMIILGTMILNHNIRGIDQSISSIYSDRLIPATTIIYLSENLYGKRLEIEKFLFFENTKTVDDVSKTLRNYEQSTDSLLTAFSKTVLTNEEVKSLLKLKNGYKASLDLQTEILAFHGDGNLTMARKLFEGEGLRIFQNNVLSLNNLAGIQSEVGEELMKESKRGMANMILISSLQIALIVVIGILILVLIKTSRIINRPKVTAHDGSYFHLN